MRVVIAPDKFKGTLSAAEVAEAIGKGFNHALPEVSVDLIPLADGGEGTTKILQERLGGESRSLTVRGPNNEIIESSFLRLDDGRAIVEMAAASGFDLVHTSRRLALGASTYGTGQLMRAALGLGCSPVVVGVGGSATTDGGTGCARAFGWRFLDERGTDLPPGGAPLIGLHTIVRPPPPIEGELDVIGICDVLAPLFGPSGAARRFAPQKGAGPDEVEALEDGLARLAEVIHSQLGVDVGELPGAGAGGGMGAGLVAFFDASLRSGSHFVAQALELEDRVDGADLVVSGEGRIDRGSLLGKVVFRVARVASSHGVSCAAIAGTLDREASDELGLAPVLSLVDLAGSERAQREPAAALELAGEVLARMVWPETREAY